jgi:hypothetical protein
MSAVSDGYGITITYSFIKIITLTLAQPARSMPAFPSAGEGGPDDYQPNSDF